MYRTGTDGRNALPTAILFPNSKGSEDQAERRLSILNAALSLSTLRALPSNHLEALRGNRATQYSIRINLQWRICFRWPADSPGPVEVEITDYHT